MNRRSFIFSVLSLLSAVNSRVFASSITNSDLDREAYLSHRLAGLIKEKESAEYIGKMYLHKYPAERNCRYLINTVILENNKFILAETMTDKVLKQKIKQKHLSDFANKQTVSLQGWVLTPVEDFRGYC